MSLGGLEALGIPSPLETYNLQSVFLGVRINLNLETHNLPTEFFGV
jgi:hypothetical protein